MNIVSDFPIAKKFYTAYTNACEKQIIILASQMQNATATARAVFGEDVSFTVRESTKDETLHADPRDVFNAA